MIAEAATALALASTGPAAITTTYPVEHPRGLMVTSGGWAYCEQMRGVARRSGYTLLCGRYPRDRYVDRNTRELRHLDWGEPRYLAHVARVVRATHRRTGGELVFIGVSYSGFGVATLAAHHPGLRPSRLIVIDSYFDLVARRARLPDWHITAREIDRETGGSTAALRRRSATAAGLARAVRSGTRLVAVWSISKYEQRLFAGATCDRTASAATVARLARLLRRPIPVWITNTRHGHNLWRHGLRIVNGHPPGRRVTFKPDGAIPPGTTC